MTMQPPPPPSYGGPPFPGPLGPPPEMLAHWGKRVAAYLVDLAILIPAYIVAVIGGAISGSEGNALGLLIMAVGYLAAIAVAIWNIVFRQGQTGYTIGKQVLGIRMLGLKDGQPIGPGLTFVRQIAHILDSLPCYIGYLWPLWDEKKQTFADKIMSTVVVEQPHQG